MNGWKTTETVDLHWLNQITPSNMTEQMINLPILTKQNKWSVYLEFGSWKFSSLLQPDAIRECTLTRQYDAVLTVLLVHINQLNRRSSAIVAREMQQRIIQEQEIYRNAKVRNFKAKYHAWWGSPSCSRGIQMNFGQTSSGLSPFQWLQLGMCCL